MREVWAGWTNGTGTALRAWYSTNKSELGGRPGVQRGPLGLPQPCRDADTGKVFHVDGGGRAVRRTHGGPVARTDGPALTARP